MWGRPRAEARQHGTLPFCCCCHWRNFIMILYLSPGALQTASNLKSKHFKIHIPRKKSLNSYQGYCSQREKRQRKWDERYPKDETPECDVIAPWGQIHGKERLGRKYHYYLLQIMKKLRHFTLALRVRSLKCATVPSKCTESAQKRQKEKKDFSTIKEIGYYFSQQKEKEIVHRASVCTCVPASRKRTHQVFV